MMLKPDEWLGSMLGKPAFSVPLNVDETNTDELRQLLSDSQTAGFYSCKVPPTAIAYIEVLMSHGFFLVDNNVQFERDAKPILPSVDVRCREAVAADEEAVRQVARRSLLYSRFHLDPHVDHAIAAELKANWAGNFFCGRRGDAMVVAEMDNNVVGFNQILAPATNHRIIDLIGVDPDYQRQGLGTGLCDAGFRLSSTDSHWLVGTQAANTRSIRFYEDAGFRYRNSSYVFHRHLENQKLL